MNIVSYSGKVNRYITPPEDEACFEEIKGMIQRGVLNEENSFYPYTGHWYKVTMTYLFWLYMTKGRIYV